MMLFPSYHSRCHAAVVARSLSQLQRGLLSTTATMADTSSDDNKSICQSCPSPTSSCPQNCKTLLQIDKHHVLHPYTSMTNPLPTFPIQSAQGIHLTLNDNRKLIDGMSSWWAAVHGYRNKTLDDAMIHQITNSMSHVMFGGLTHSPAVKLAARLLQMVNNDYHHSASSTESEEEEEETSAYNNIDYLERIQSNTDDYHLTKVFFCDSGSISVEVAMKMSIQYWFTLNQPTKTKFISLTNGYHGDTFGAMGICDPVNGMHTMFEGILSQQYFVQSPTGPSIHDATETIQQMKDTLNKHHETIAAVIMEPIVQGAGGMKFYHPIVLQKVRELCDEYNVLLIFDEIATGFGRTGTLFAGWQNEDTYHPWSSLDDTGSSSEMRSNQSKCNISANETTTTANEIVYPDIVCLGKALTGGYMTMGATLTTSKVAHGISDTGGVFMHGPTFMANPLACAVSLASITLLMESPWKVRVRTVEQSLIQHLSPLAELDTHVKEVRVLGAIGVCELHAGLDREGMANVQRMLVDEGVWLRPFGKLLYTMPPFNCDELRDEHVQKIGDAMYNVVSKL